MKEATSWIFSPVIQMCNKTHVPSRKWKQRRWFSAVMFTMLPVVVLLWSLSLSPAGCCANPLYISLSLCLCSFLRVAMRCVQIELRGSAVAWWFPATKACPASLTCQSKPKTCGRSHGSRCSWSSVSGMGSLGRFGWVRIESPLSKGATRKEPHRADGDTRHSPKHRPIIRWVGSNENMGKKCW